MEAAPRTLKEARLPSYREEWGRAMQRELQMCRDFKSYDLVRRPKDHTVMSTTWTFTRKPEERFKVRWEAQGYAQSAGIDYDETFSPVCRFGSVRLILDFANEHDRLVHHLDTTNAFLHAPLINYDVYVNQPPGFIQTDPESCEECVCKLKRSLYGLKQSSLNWFRIFNNKLREFGFKPLRSDQWVLLFQREEKIAIVTVYVDDVLITGSDNDILTEVNSFITNAFAVKDLGEVSMIIGVTVTRESKGGTLHYTLLPDEVPLPNSGDSQLLADDTKRRYQEITGALVYLQSCTRPDLSFSVLQLARHINRPSKRHMSAAKRTLRFVQGTRYTSFPYHRGHFKLHGNAALSWPSHKQSLVTRSSTECELVSLVEATDKARYLWTFLQEIGHDAAPVPIMEDNKGTFDLAQHASFSKRTKHITVRVRYMHEQV
ncbi:unnamed protein product, partial [Discosporangium mesarthrocarpum]